MNWLAGANRTLLGIASRLGAVIVMGTMTALVKLCVEQGVHPMEVVFFRNAFAFIPIVAYIMMTDGPRVLRTQRPGAHLVRSAIGVTGMICGFTALGMMPIAEFTAIQFAAPLFITALSAPILGEKVEPRLWAAVAVGFVGVLVMTRPDPANMTGVASMLAIGQAFATAGAMLAIRQLGRTEPGPAIVFYFTVAAALVGAAALPFVWSAPSPGALILLIGCGLCGGVGQLLLTQAFKLAPAAVVAPFDYATLLWVGLLGWLIWNEFPKTQTLAGGALVVASGLYIVWRETRRMRQAEA
jgi:drug/metabolite transporter (DMT)-like permease